MDTSTVRPAAIACAIAITVLLIGGCTWPSITAPIGSAWEPDDVAKLQGLWIGENGNYSVVVHHEGMLYVANQAFDPKSLVFEVRTIEVTRRMVENTRLLFGKEVFGKEEDNPGYQFLLIETEADGSVSLRVPSAKFFADAVKTSKLRGKTGQSRWTDEPWVDLESDERGFRALLRTAKMEEMFPMKTRVVLRKVPRSERFLVLGRRSGQEEGKCQEPKPADEAFEKGKASVVNKDWFPSDGKVAGASGSSCAGALDRLAELGYRSSADIGGPIKDLDLTPSRITDSELGLLQAFAELETLDLGPKITGEGLHHLKVLKNLRTIGLARSGITDAHLVELVGLVSLKGIEAPQGMTDRGLRHLARVPNLEWLDLDACPVTDEGIKCLVQSGNLQDVGLSACHRLTDAGVWYLSKVKTLTGMNLGLTGVTDEGIGYLRGLANLRALVLCGTTIGDNAMEYLSAATNLVELDLDCTRVSDGGLAHLSSLARLETLTLRCTQITDAGLDHLSRLRRLRHLDLSGTKTTIAGRTRLKSRLPRLEVYFPQPDMDQRIPVPDNVAPAHDGIAGATKRLQDRDAQVRKDAASILGRMGARAKEAMPALTKLLQDKDSQVRYAALVALANLGPAAKDAIPAYAALLRDEEDKIRCAAAGALGKMGPVAKDAIPALVKRLKDDELLVRYTAAWSLGKMGPVARAAVSDLTNLLQDEEEPVRQAAKKALKEIGQ